jgi:hypothetical protein
LKFTQKSRRADHQKQIVTHDECIAGKTLMAANPSQQSTVIEFTCLWTVNKTQKQKKWQDGTLRFHQFNRRAMLYDDFPRLIVSLIMKATN